MMLDEPPCACCEEVEYQLRGGTDPDGPVAGLDGLSLPGMANVLHSLAARSEVLEAGIRRFLAVSDEVGTFECQCIAGGSTMEPEDRNRLEDAEEELRSLLDDPDDR